MGQSTWGVQFQSQLLLLLIMSKLIAVLACLAVVVAVASAEPRYAKLQNSLAAPWTRSSCAKERSKMPGTSAGMLPASKIVSMVSLELLTARLVSVMFWSGWDSCHARWTE